MKEVMHLSGYARRPSGEAGMKGLQWAVVKWIGWACTAALLLSACARDLPLPEGIDLQGKPRIIVTKERIEIDGHVLGLAANSTDATFTTHWDQLPAFAPQGDRLGHELGCPELSRKGQTDQREHRATDP